MPDLKVISMDDDELELENTIRQLISAESRRRRSTEYRIVIRQLKACATAASWRSDRGRFELCRTGGSLAVP